MITRCSKSATRNLISMSSLNWTRERAVLEKELEPVRAKRNQLKDEIKKIQSGAKEIETELGKLTG